MACDIQGVMTHLVGSVDTSFSSPKILICAAHIETPYTISRVYKFLRVSSVSLARHADPKRGMTPF